jgi:hypothetical protein
MAQAVSHWPLTAETRVRSRVSPYGIYGAQSNNGAGFSPSSFFPVSIIPPWLLILIYNMGMNNRPIGGQWRVQKM